MCLNIFVGIKRFYYILAQRGPYAETNKHGHSIRSKQEMWLHPGQEKASCAVVPGPPWNLELGEGLTQQISAKADCGLAAPQKWGTANYPEQFPCGFWDRIKDWVFPSMKWALWPEVPAAASVKPTKSQLDQELNVREQNWEELTQGSQKWGRGWCGYSEFRVITLWFSYCVQCCQEFTTTKSLKHSTE